MLRRSSKTDHKQRRNGPPRLLVVEDDADVARLLGKLFRRAGYEVAEVGDHQVAMVTLANEPEPIDAVVASFSGGGSASCLKLLDSIRNSHNPVICKTRVVMVIDNPRQQMFSWQSGADDILTRPYQAVQLVQSVELALKRQDQERGEYRRERIDAVKNSVVRDGRLVDAAVTGPVQFS